MITTTLLEDGHQHEELRT